MATGTDYGTRYKKAYTAYGQGNLDEAASSIERLAEDFPNDPNILLLYGHVCLNLEQYDQARQHYESVLQLTEQGDLRDCATQGLEQLQQQQISADEASREVLQEQPGESTVASGFSQFSGLPSQMEPEEGLTEDFTQTESGELDVDGLNWDSQAFEDIPDSGEATLGQTYSFANPFDEEDHDSAYGQEGEAFSYEPEDQQEPSFGEATGILPAKEGQPLDFVGESNGYAGRADLAEETVIRQGPVSEELLTSGRESFLDGLDLSSEDLAEISQFDLGGATPEGLGAESEPEVSTEMLDFQATLRPSAPAEGAELAPRVAPGLVDASPLLKPTVEVKQGWLAWFENASLIQKQWIVSGLAGLAPILAILLFSLSSGTPEVAKSTGKSQKAPATNNKVEQVASFSPFSSVGRWILLLAGGASFGTTFLLGQVVTRQAKRTLNDLQAQFEAIYEGNFNVRATVYSQDELGQLATRFNQIGRTISMTTGQAHSRAREMERAKEELQRLVIRLLDDVEGAARGDLTVEAKVTADILGAVADAFNLTIQNLREIVRQVKAAAKQVNQGATDSESFARKNSSESLRMAEELAVTLQSVQVMNESIQRVAENAGEAEQVARTSSLTALRGGEAVERTVAGVLQIQETVSETARKVKRLAEASQEISKIVTVISSIASRTNLLALNASLQAARAGEAGRGFAIVADEVRQLADRSAKSLKEIEQIVSQIQGETGAVMAAMEEGIQQVLDVSQRSEQAKRALDEIIEVSNHIDQLVQSITADTVQQKENSQAVSQVMQSVEMTAQATSQESQRVAGSLQKLVAISRDLLNSVERFRID